ncbi:MULTISPECIES: aromatic ring-hydroxylating dioxygenase subunit alpha [unclassified Mycobacterium]|uniref:aromatic ring-hydroxylating oxygenase subunit alpha n=1 Tax=unclassified Mycobacterium TaxID=2642494 RepID=UPI0029C901E4|nr:MULTISPECIES: aromatic ring-hydroxylating dioxygenase subunit alpha [unclassified Mycobacterium]
MLTEPDLRQRIGPMLADGRTIRELVDLDKREVALRVLSDPEVYRWELEKLFARTWTIVGHVSEIPKPGDFVLRSIGEDKVIVSRTRSGSVAAVLNVCAHRGAELCRADEGNAKNFMCPYHGWTFDCEGRMLSAPFEREVYGELDKSGLGLRKASVAVRHGVIFANLDPDPEPLDEYLGEEMCWYFDQLYGQTEQVVMGPPLRQFVNANWKAIVDQFAGDAYHFHTTHRAMGELGVITADRTDPKGWTVEGLWVRMAGSGSWGCSDVLGPLFASTGIERTHPLAGWLMIGLLFPATGITSFPLPDPESMFPTIGGFVPRGPDATEWWTLQLVPKHVSEEVRKILRAGATVQNTVLPDDLENWVSMSRGARGVVSRQGTIKYNTPPRPANNPRSWPGPGSVYEGMHSDDSQWGFWLQWLEEMTRE